MDSDNIIRLEVFSMRPDLMDDIEKRHLECLSPAHVLDLLDWVERPWFPDGKARVCGLVESMRDEAVRIAGRIGKETHDEAIRKRLEAMMQVQELRVHALVGLRVLEDPNSVETLRHWISDHDRDTVYNLATALAEIASADAIAVLQEMSATGSPDRVVRGCIEGSLQEAIAKKTWREQGGV